MWRNQANSIWIGSFSATMIVNHFSSSAFILFHRDSRTPRSLRLWLTTAVYWKVWQLVTLVENNCLRVQSCGTMCVRTQRRLFLPSVVHRSVLSRCGHAVLALLYPFTWQHTFVPVLPASMLDVSCSPTPFLIGVLAPCLPQLLELPIEEVGQNPVSKMSSWIKCDSLSPPLLEAFFFFYALSHAPQYHLSAVWKDAEQLPETSHRPTSLLLLRNFQSATVILSSHSVPRCS